MALDYRQMSDADKALYVANQSALQAREQAQYLGQVRAEEMHNEIVRAQQITGKTFYSEGGQAGGSSKYTSDSQGSSAPVSGSSEWWAAQVAGREAAAAANTQYTPVSQSAPGYSSYVAPPASTVAAAAQQAQQSNVDYISSLPKPFVSSQAAVTQSQTDQAYIQSLPRPFLSSVAQQSSPDMYNPVSPDGTVKRVYMPEGNYAQQEFSNAKLGFANEDGKSTGEMGLYTKLPAGRTAIDPNTGKQTEYILIGGGSRNFLQSGTGGFAAATPLVYAEGGVGKGIFKTADVYAPGVLSSGVSADYLKDMIGNLNSGKLSPFDVPVSRLGSEAYGGIVQPLDGRTLGNITYEDVSNRAPWNFASYVNPTDVNLSKSDLPGVSIPWGIGADAPAIFSMTTAGGVGAPIQGKSFVADVSTPLSSEFRSSGVNLGYGIYGDVSSVKRIAPVATGVKNEEMVEVPSFLTLGGVGGLTAYSPGYGSTTGFSLPPAAGPLAGFGLGLIGTTRLEQSGYLGLTGPTEGFSVRSAGESVGAFVFRAGRDYGTAWNKRLALDANIDYERNAKQNYEDTPVRNLPGGFSLPKISDAPDMPMLNAPGRGSEQVMNAPGQGFAGIVGLPGAGAAMLFKTSSSASSGGSQSNFFPSYIGGPQIIEMPRSQIIPTPAVKEAQRTAGGSIAQSIDTGRSLYDLTSAPTAAAAATKAKTQRTYADALSNSYFDANAKSNEFAFAQPRVTSNTRNPSQTTISSPFASPISDAMAFGFPSTTTTTRTRPATATPPTTVTNPFTTETMPRSRPDQKQDLRDIKLPNFDLTGGSSGGASGLNRGRSAYREIIPIRSSLTEFFRAAPARAPARQASPKRTTYPQVKLPKMGKSRNVFSGVIRVQKKQRG